MKLTTKFLAAAVALGWATSAYASDHQDGDLVKNDASTDLADLFVFPNGDNVVLAMTVNPNADSTSKFSDAAYYVFHTKSYATFSGTPTGSVDVICKFDNNGKISCWVGDDEFLNGSASAETGLQSADKKVKVYAGVRADPFYFYLTGFQAARTAVLGAIGSATPPMLYASGCPQLDGGTVTALQTALSTTTQSKNNFVGSNVLGITIELDKSLLTKNADEVISVWASTNSMNN